MNQTLDGLKRHRFLKLKLDLQSQKIETYIVSIHLTFDSIF